MTLIGPVCRALRVLSARLTLNVQRVQRSTYMHSRSTPTVIRRTSVRFLLYLPYYRPSICNNDGAVTFGRLLLSCVAYRFSAQSFRWYGLDFTYTPSLTPHLRDTNKTKSIRGEGHQLKLLGRESREVNGMRHNLPPPGTCECSYSGQKRRKCRTVGSGKLDDHEYSKPLYNKQGHGAS
jgi:hypothetical protein